MLKDMATTGLVPTVFVAVTVMELAPAADGVPAIVPAVVLNDIPVGTVPLTRA